ncbi:MAG TPA: ClpP-like prohead protease/major capsid protein fusion protein [Frateuria sp.]|uniref:ClpP-like prohead protease/major capsid protein fusion protein n=1 Tax=Frateuria sp. TaxID=2211372 RepID=UPI002D802B6A|nr:ClpP-like prohead protease/major capsid protein fusion protein [Frateuria sp.]HET6804642.1 ClpP-like prohead protease/major capsid protein fusion protein [Frateuria sp.]
MRNLILSLRALAVRVLLAAVAVLAGPLPVRQCRRFGAFAEADPATGLPRIRPVMVLRPVGASSTEYELLIYGDIGDSWWGESVTALSVVQQLQALDASVTQINVRINSYGGSVSDGIAIYNALKRHSARKVVTVDGVAMSSASLIAMAGDEVQMPATSLLMIHAPWGYAQGNAQDMRAMAEVLDTYASAMAGAYSGKSGRGRADMLALLADGQDHYYTGEQAVTEGFADKVIDPLADTTTDDESQARAAGVSRLLAGAPDHIRQIAMSAAGKHPRALPKATKPRLVVPEGIDLESLQTALASASGQRALVAALTTAASANDGDLEMKVRKLFAAMASLREQAADPSDGNRGAGGGAAQPNAADVHAALRVRNEEITAMVTPYLARDGVQAIYTAALADPAMSVDRVRQQLLDKIGAQTTPIAGGARVELVADEADKFRAAGQNAILARAGVVQADGQNPLRGYRLIEIARASLERTGTARRGMDSMDVVGAAFTTTTDFPALLTSTARAALLRGYDEAPETFDQWTRAGTLTDFREASRAGLGFFSELDKIGEDGEYKYGTFGSSGQSIVLATYGKLFAITRQAIINDDLGAFTAVPQKMGRAAKRTIGNLVYAILSNNPKLADGLALFHATHGNLAAAAGITTASVGALRKLLMAQKVDGQAINIPLKYLIVPANLEDDAVLVRDNQFEVKADGSVSSNANTQRGRFEVVSDGRLAGNAWFGAADPNLFDTVEVAYLDGNQTPFLDQKDGWTIDGTEYKVRIDAGVAPLDSRGLAKNPGQ